MSVSTGERHRAELALEGRRSAKNLEELETVQLPSVGDRIRQARLQAGLSENEIARRLGITIHSYCDLESYDYEAFTDLSLKELAELGGILGVQPRVLLLGREGEGGKQTVTFEDVTAHIAKKVSESGLTADQLGDLIGWDIKPLLGDPLSLSGYTVEALYDICKVVDCDWVAALPDAGKAAEGETVGGALT
jgi:transcriptional regulator with XRE-family HTH domain